MKDDCKKQQKKNKERSWGNRSYSERMRAK